MSLEKAQESYQHFTSSFQSLVLGTAGKDGEPLSSYAPFIEDEQRNFYVYVSELSKHTQHLRECERASVLFLQDESETKQIYARSRLNYTCDIEQIDRESQAFEDYMVKFADKFGGIIKSLKGMGDFKLFRLKPKDGRFVMGFGSAFEIKGDDLSQLVHLGGGGNPHGHNPHGNPHGHNPHGNPHGHNPHGNPHGHNPHAAVSTPAKDAPRSPGLKGDYEALLAERGGRMYPRDAAKELGVSELELVAVLDGVEFWDARPEDILGDLHQLGNVMSMVRSDHAVSEVNQTFPKWEPREGEKNTVSEGALTLQLDVERLKHILLKVDGKRHSLQFFDASGACLQKVVVAARSDLGALAQLRSKYALEKAPELKVEAGPALEADHAAVDPKAIQESWASLAGPQQANALFEKFNVKRWQGLEALGQDVAHCLKDLAPMTLLKHLADSKLAVRHSLSNGPVSQSFEGRFKNIQDAMGFSNVLDSGFNLHLRSDAVCGVWLLKSEGGEAEQYWIEVYGGDHELISSFSLAESSLGEEELSNARSQWKAVVEALKA
jgi:putative heme degradation protein